MGTSLIPRMRIYLMYTDTVNTTKKIRSGISKGNKEEEVQIPPSKFNYNQRLQRILGGALFIRWLRIRTPPPPHPLLESS